MTRLFLASEMKHPVSIEKLKTFIGGSFGGKKILYIPTAANGEEHRESWRKGPSVKMVNAFGADVEFFELENKSRLEVDKATENIDILWIHGGMAGYLMYWIRRVGLDKLIPELLEKGVLYVGSSAGCWICSKELNVPEWYMGEEEVGASLLPGLGLIDFEFFPHYKDEYLSEIKKHWKKGDLYLMKNGEVVTIVDGKIEILGEKRILRDSKLITV